MGSVVKYSVKSDSKARYRVIYRDNTNKQVWKSGFTRKYDAERYLREKETAKDRGEYIDPADARVTVKTLGEEWLKTRKSVMKPSAFRSLDSAWRIHVVDQWGSREVGSLKSSEVQAWVSELSEKRSATTVLRCHGVLAGILDAAMKDLRITRNVARDLALPRKRSKGKTYLSHEQVASLAEESLYPDLVLFLAYTGLRWGEATGLRVKHVDRVRRRVSVEENAVMVGGHIEVGTPKTHEVRSVPYPAFLESAVDAAVEGKRQSELLFGDGKIHMRLPNSVRGWFTGAVERLQAKDDDFPRVTPHDLRHTAASLAISAGANVKAVQRMLGHASAAMTLDVYGDLFEDDLDGVADALDQARSRSLVRFSLDSDDSGNEETP